MRYKLWWLVSETSLSHAGLTSSTLINLLGRSPTNDNSRHAWIWIDILYLQIKRPTLPYNKGQSGCCRTVCI